MSAKFIKQAFFLLFHKKRKIFAFFSETELETDASNTGVNDMGFEVKGAVRKPCAAGGTMEAVDGKGTGESLSDAEGEGMFRSAMVKGQGALSAVRGSRKCQTEP